MTDVMSRLALMAAAHDLPALGTFLHDHPGILHLGEAYRTYRIMTFDTDPDIMLMDEPFSALDENTRSILDRDIVMIWSEEKKTVIFVTHILDEALTIATRIILLSDSPGKIVIEWRLEPGKERDRHSSEFITLKKEITETLIANSKDGAL